MRQYFPSTDYKGLTSDDKAGANEWDSSAGLVQGLSNTAAVVNKEAAVNLHDTRVMTRQNNAMT